MARSAYTEGERKAMTHAFRFEIGGKVVRKRAKVKAATSSLIVTITVEDVQRAIKLNGHGDGMNCAGAVCVKRHGALFPHAFTGYAEWWYRRVYISTRNNKDNFPIACVAYAHRSKIAQLFDTKVGLQKLLKMIQADGPIDVELMPLPKYQPRKGNARSGPSGEHAKPKGHKLRVMRVREGGLGIAA